MRPPTAGLETDQQPPLALPFAHFVTGALVLLVGGAIAGLGPFVLPIQASNVGTIHLLLAGWIGTTIMGAMIQFVPVWSGRRLHSRRLSLASLWLVVVGLTGTVGVFLTRAYAWFPLWASLLLVGFWVFAYTVVRTLPPVRDLDVTEAHFLVAIGSLAVGTSLGWLLATGIGRGRWILPGVGPGSLLLAHMTLTVFGFVLTTIVGALYQLAPMFTQSETTRLDAHLRHVELATLPPGVALLATGRLLESVLLARLGGVGIVAGALAFAVYLFRRLWGAEVETGPMLRRYWLVGASLLGWAVLSVPAWLLGPLSYFRRFGAPGATHLLFVGVFTLTVIGTFYHVVPFLVWYHRYSDRLGYEAVPMIDDLYDERLARIEFVLLAIGLGALWFGELLGAPWYVLMIGGNVLGLGVLLFAGNMALVVYRHRPATGKEVLAVMAGKFPESE